MFKTKAVNPKPSSNTFYLLDKNYKEKKNSIALTSVGGLAQLLSVSGDSNSFSHGPGVSLYDEDGQIIEKLFADVVISEHSENGKKRRNIHMTVTSKDGKFITLATHISNIDKPSTAYAAVIGSDTLENFGKTVMIQNHPAGVNTPAAVSFTPLWCWGSNGIYGSPLESC